MDIPIGRTTENVEGIGAYVSAAPRILTADFTEALSPLTRPTVALGVRITFFAVMRTTYTDTIIIAITRRTIDVLITAFAIVDSAETTVAGALARKCPIIARQTVPITADAPRRTWQRALALPLQASGERTTLPCLGAELPLLEQTVIFHRRNRITHVLGHVTAVTIRHAARSHSARVGERPGALAIGAIHLSCAGQTVIDAPFAD